MFTQGGGQVAPGPFAAPITGAEQQLLGQVQQQATQPSAAAQAGQSFLQQLLSGQGQGLTTVGEMGAGTPQGQENPFLAQAIQTAQRPVIQALTEDIAPALRAQFTTAGQQIQGQGSSPFQLAAARAQSGTADALGDIATNLAFQDFAQRQQLGSQEFQQARGLQTQQELQGRQQQLDAVSQASNLDRAQLENVLAGLEAQALPRLVEQLGIDRGLEEFRRREAQLLEAIQTAGTLASPNIAIASEGRSRATENPDLSQAIGSGIGAFAAFSSRDYKDDVTVADEHELAEAVRDVELASFTYKPEMHIPGQFVGPIAEDVPAVFRGADGKTVNLYNMVSGLVAASHEKDTEIKALKDRLQALEEANHG